MTRYDGPRPAIPWILTLLLVLAAPGEIPGQQPWAEALLDNSTAPESSWESADEVDHAPSSSESEPTDGHAWYLLGRSFHLAGEYEAAIASWKRAEALEFALPYTRYNIAAAYARLGDKDTAFGWLDSALDVGFGEIDLLIVDDDMESIRQDARFAPAVLRAYQNSDSCSDPEGQKKVDLWVRGSGDVEKSGFQFASLYAAGGACSASARARASRRTATLEE